MPRERMFNPPPEEESFEAQMADLDVPIERPNKKEARAVTPWLTRRNPGIKPFEGIRLMRSYLAISIKVAEKLAQEAGDGVPRAALRVIEYEGKKALALKYDPRGYTISIKSVNHSLCRITTAAVIETLHEAGLQMGRYKVKKISGGYLAVPEDKK